MKLQRIQTSRLRDRAGGRVFAFLRCLPFLACFSLANSTKATVPTSDLPDFDALPNFAEFGNQQVDNLATIFGNVGVSAGGQLQVNSPATIEGDIYLAHPVTLMQMGLVTGVTFNNQDLATEQNTVISASAALGKLAPDQTITGNQTTALNFNVPAGQVEVVNLEGGLNLNNQNITLSGDGDLVLNIENSFSLDGSASIVGNPANIFVNYVGDSTITTSVPTTIDGKLFDPDADANLSGDAQGGIYGGDGTITLDSGAEITPVPEPKELMWAGFAALLVHLARRRLTA